MVSCVLLWARPGMEATLSAYEDKVLRLLASTAGVSWSAGLSCLAHWCTMLRSVVLDGPLMHPRCRQATALLA